MVEGQYKLHIEVPNGADIYEIYVDNEDQLYITTDEESGYGRKVDWCGECATADFPDGVETKWDDEKQKELRLCPHCGHRLTKRNETQINEFVEKPVLGDFFSRRTYATRVINSPWGKMQLHLSTDSPHCYFANVRSGDSGDYEIPVNVVRQLINENFSASAAKAAFEESKSSILQYGIWSDHLEILVRGLLRDPNPVGQRDLTVNPALVDTGFVLSGYQQ